MDLSVQKSLRLAAALSIAQAAMIAYYLLQIEKTVLVNEKRQIFLADIVSRNVDRLEEFDLIALRELGVIKPPSA